MADTHYADDIATGMGNGSRLRIAGRPREGTDEKLVLLEEPGEPILMHWSGVLIPHYKKDCPNCNGKTEPKPFYYIGGATLASELVIVELTPKCYNSAAAAARQFSPNIRGTDLFGNPLAVSAIRFSGLLVRISRASFRASPRVLRCDQRVRPKVEWNYQTKLELARIWGIPIKPRLYRAEGQ